MKQKFIGSTYGIKRISEAGAGYIYNSIVSIVREINKETNNRRGISTENLRELVKNLSISLDELDLEMKLNSNGNKVQGNN